MIVANKAANDQSNNAANKKVILQNCASFIHCINRINNTQVIDTLDIGIVMLMYNLIEYTDNCLKASWILWQYCRNKPDLVADTITNFNAANASTDLFNNKPNRQRWQKKCRSNGIIKTFWRTLEIPLINCIKHIIVGTDVTDQKSE